MGQRGTKRKKESKIIRRKRQIKKVKQSERAITENI